MIHDFALVRMNGKARRFILAMLLVAAPLSPALAGSTEMARKFVDLLRYEDQYLDYRKSCQSVNQAIPIEKLMDNTPGRKNGIGPGTRYWPEVLAANERYVNEMCARPSQHEFLEAMADGYASVLSDDDLAAALRFYSTAAGRKLIEAHRKAAKNVHQEWTRINGSYIPVATQRFNRALEDLYQRAEREGK